MDFRYLLNRQIENLITALPEDFNVLGMALESTNSGVIITDNRLPDNPIVFCNHAFENMTGYSRAEIVGRNCRFLQESDNQQQSLISLRLAIANGSPITIELINYHKDGTPFWNELSIAPVRDPEGAVSHFIGIQNDITRKKARETDLMQQIDLLNNRLEKQKNYINEVENILTRILRGTQQCIVFLDENLNMVKANSYFYELFNLREEEITNKPFMEIESALWNNPDLKSLLMRLLNSDKVFEGFKLPIPEGKEHCHEVIIG